MENNKSTQKAGMEKQQRTTADTVGMSLNNNMMKGKGETGGKGETKGGWGRKKCIQGKIIMQKSIGEKKSPNFYGSRKI